MYQCCQISIHILHSNHYRIKFATILENVDYLLQKTFYLSYVKF